MKIEDAKLRLSEAEKLLETAPAAEFGTFEQAGRILNVFITRRLKTKAKKARVWKNSAFLSALSNVKYGFNPVASLSRGGKDGIFLLTRQYKPINSMMLKLFSRFIDRRHPEYLELVSFLKLLEKNLSAVRVVSHHLRLLGLMELTGESNNNQRLVLVDIDNEKDI
jgi:hypothetical protein